MQLDVESLRAFIAVIDLGGMTRAAESLEVSQSAVSWKIKRLEEKVGRELLIREGHSLRPSRDGRELLHYARAMVDTHDEAVRRLKSSELTGTVKVGTPEEISAERICAVLSRFNRIHPKTSIEFFVDRSFRLSSMLARSELDVAVLQVLENNLRPEDKILWTDPLIWVCAPDCAYEEGLVPLITFGEGGFYRPLAQQALTEAGIPFTVTFSGPSAASVIGAAEAGLGVAVLAECSVKGDLIRWPRAESIPPLPDSMYVARAAAGEPSVVATELISDIVGELQTE
ncbi:MAG: LysR substrate-binding domain-containing protein [Acidimicrobiaceae bacterium]|nr:LysR substrate-binding domain-containing protein [Acidimicrobiaceae bacterium]